MLLRLPLKPTVPLEAPAKRVAVRVGDRHRRVVERRLDMDDRPAHIASRFSLLGLSHRSIAPDFEGIRADLVP